MDEKKVISIEDRIPKLKEARKKKANRRLVYYLSVLFVLIFIIVYLQSPLSNVKTVHVEGNKYITDETIMTLTGMNEKTNIWEVSSKKLEEKLLEEPLIKEAKVARKLPQSIQITIEEHFIAGLVEEEATYALILPNGKKVAMSTNPVDLSEAPLLKGFKDDESLTAMAKQLSMTDLEVFHLISEIVWQESDGSQSKIMLYMNDGFIVDTVIRQFAEKMEDYPSIVAQIDAGEKGIIHMGVGTYFESLD